MTLEDGRKALNYRDLAIAAHKQRFRKSKGDS